MEKMVYLITSTFNVEDDYGNNYNSKVNIKPQIFATQEAAEAELWNRINAHKERWETAHHKKAAEQAVKIMEDKPNYKEVWFGELYADAEDGDDEYEDYDYSVDYDYGVRMTALPLE